jgi:hypothetical protein
MPWYLFPGATVTEQRQAYNAWHDQVCTAEGIPRPGQYQHDNSDAIENCWTDSYAHARRTTDGRAVMFLPRGDPHAAGLTQTTVNTGDPADPSDQGDFAGAPVTPIAAPQPIPRTYQGRPVPRTITNEPA